MTTFRRKKVHFIARNVSRNILKARDRETRSLKIILNFPQ